MNEPGPAPPTPRHEPVDADGNRVRDQAAVIAQALLGMAGGAAAGWIAGGSSAAIPIGAVGMFAALVAGYGASNGVLLLALPFVLARYARRAAKGETVSGPSAEGRVAAALAIHAINAMLYAGALACAIATAVVVEHASFLRALAAFAALAFLMTRFTRRAREAIE